MDDSMKRSRSQVMYKYLPEAYIDYYNKNTRTAYTARVKRWHSRRLENVNNERLLLSVERAIKSFDDKEKVKGFSMNFTCEEYDILEPVSTDKDPRIFAEIDPNIFYCEKCMKVYRVNHKFVAHNDHGLESKCCKASLKQIRLVYICKCGFAEGLKLRPCNIHGFEDVRYGNKFNFYCGKCKKTIGTFKKCTNCGTKLETKNPLDQSVLIPHSVAIIDLINMREEKLIQNISFSSEAIISKYLRLIEDNKFNQLYDYKEKNISEIENEKDQQKTVLLQQGIPEGMINKIFETMRSDDGLSKTIKKAISKTILSDSDIEKK